MTFGDQTRQLDAVLVPNLGPDFLILDNGTMSNFGATRDWHHEHLPFANSQGATPATHLMHTRASRSENIHTPSGESSSTPAASLGRYVAAVSSTFEPLAVRLQGAVTLPAGHATMVCASTDSRSVGDY